ncbi:MAG: YbjN domain-containing protein [Henriciella sp.]|nr:YbjN domain-containing protein [Henriciella sp.]
MIKLALTALLSTTCIVAASAQEATPLDESRLVRGVTITDLEAIVLAKGHTVTSRDNDTHNVIAETDTGYKYSMKGTACGDDGVCKGINIIASYNMNDKMSLESLNKANVQYAAASVWKQGDSVGISRYLILDGGMTIENIKVNLTNLLSLAPKAIAIVEGTDESSNIATETGDLQFGDDSGTYANDDACDDGRFHDDGDDFTFKRQHVMHDATDCRAELAAGDISLQLDFGDNLGEYADDGTCDDSRFIGDGRSILMTDSHIKKDAGDCIAAYQAGTISQK